MTGGGTIGGVTFASLGLLLTKADVPLLPDTRQTEEEIPGMDGTLDMETTYGPRLINLTFQLVAASEGEYQIRLQQIASVFNARAGIKELVLDRISGKRWMVKYNGSISVDKIAQLGTFTVPLKAFYPFAESVKDTTVAPTLNDGYTLGMGLKLGMSAADYTFAIDSTPKAVTVYNAGTYDAKPIIRVTGPASSVTIKNETTGETLTWANTLAAGSVLEIDCNKSTITLNGGNSFYYFAGVFPRLSPGDNHFTVTAAGATVSFVFRHTYLY